MSESVNLPALGESVTEGTVTRWLKNVGDRVEIDEPLVEVSTDKVDTEIPSPIAGVIEEILVGEDETVEVGSPLVRIGDGSGAAAPAEEPAPAEETAPAEEAAPAPEATPASEAAPAPEAAPAEQSSHADGAAPADEAAPAEPEAPHQASAPAAAEPTPAPETTPPAEKPQAASTPAPESPTAPTQTAGPDSSGASYVTPIVRKLAADKGVDLNRVTGTGVGGRVRRQDVIAAAESATTGAPAGNAPRPRPEASPLRGTTVPMSRLRKVIAERAVASMQSTAQLTTVVEADVTKLAALRLAAKDEFHKATGAKLTFLPFFAKAATEALKAYPIINASVDGDSIVYPSTENLSIAVDTERGLLTPVVRDAGDRTIAELASDIADLAARTRDNQLKPDELAGGTFTLTNTGSRGALFDTPVVFLPQVAILGTGIVAKKPAVVSVDGSDAIAIRSTVYLALSYDHRIVDGADAARFLTAVKDRLEDADFESDLGI
jgi:pyruvate dehydrogenase E2 component (dihydrolipoamide acetyltransferase)